MFLANARRLSYHSQHPIQLLGELKDIEWDVVLLSETRSVTRKYVLDGGHVLFTSLSENVCSGTGILLNERHVRKSKKHPLY